MCHPVSGAGEEKQNSSICWETVAVASECVLEEGKTNGGFADCMICWTWANAGQILGAKNFFFFNGKP